MLTIDSRENSKLSKLVIQKAQALKIPNEKKWIEIGDYVYDDVCFEAKSAVDFLGSVMSKRLWTQLDNMDRHYKTNVVIIHGDMQEAIMSIIEHSPSNVPIGSRSIMLNNKFLGATAICKMKPITRDTIEPHIFKRLTTGDLRIDLLSSIKGVSVKKAKELIKAYGSIMEVGECSAFELQAIEGIGDTLAKRIVTTLNSEEKVKI